MGGGCDCSKKCNRRTFHTKPEKQKEKDKECDCVCDGYGAPSSGYGAPSYDYQAPSVGYGAPVESYGAPVDSYGAPIQSYAAPYDSYGVPETGYVAPSSGYGAPSSIVLATEHLDHIRRRKKKRTRAVIAVDTQHMNMVLQQFHTNPQHQHIMHLHIQLPPTMLLLITPPHTIPVTDEPSAHTKTRKKTRVKPPDSLGYNLI